MLFVRTHAVAVCRLQLLSTAEMGVPFVAGIVGISGVGKTTFASKISQNTGWQHLVASELLFSGKEAKGLSYQQANRLSALDESEFLLPRRFNEARDNSAEVILLDAHTAIETSQGLIAVPSGVFKAVSVGVFVFVSAKGQVILEHRLNDTARARHLVNADELSRLQRATLTITVEIACELCIPVSEVSFEATALAIEKIRAHL